MAKTDDWMPLYIAHYLRDTARLSTLGHGAYLLLIMDYWISGPPLDDDDDLAAITRLSVPEWQKLRPKIQPFFTIKNGKWLHKRIEAEAEKAAEIQNGRVRAGREGAAKRWQNYSEANGEANGDANGKSNSEGNSKGNGNGKSIAEPIANAWQNQWQKVWQIDAPLPIPIPLPLQEQIPKPKPSRSTIVQKNTSAARQSAAGSTGEPEKKTNATRAGSIASYLRSQGIDTASTRDEVIEFANWDVSQAILDEAIEKAKLHLQGKRISSAYLKPIVADLLKPKPAKARQPAWWTSEKTIEAKAREVGCWPARGGESWQDLKARIDAKLHEQARGQPP